MRGAISTDKGAAPNSWKSVQHIFYFSFGVFLGNGMVGTLPGGIWLKIRRGSKIFMVKDYQMANIRQSTGTGIIYKIPVVST